MGDREHPVLTPGHTRQKDLRVRQTREALEHPVGTSKLVEYGHKLASRFKPLAQNHPDGRTWLLVCALLVGMLVPIWIGEYAPLYDYPNHMLEAQIAAHYTDSQFDYADSYEINPNWYLRSNALSTLLMIGLGQVIPITLAGRLVLSFYLALFVSGWTLLARWAGNEWPLMLLAPPVAYNFAFTSGWINFCYGIALGLYVLVVYLRWLAKGQPRDLLYIACLMLLAYMAHLTVWGLWMVGMSAMLAVEKFQVRRHGVLMLAMNSALPLLLATRPGLGAAIVLIGPLIWGGAGLVRRLCINRGVIILGMLATTGLMLALTKVVEPFAHTLSPELDFDQFDKLTFPFRLFSLPHQFLPPTSWLITYNLVLLAFILALMALLVRSTLRQSDRNRDRWLAAIALLGFLYVIVPSRTPDIWVTEPRVLLLVVFVALVGARLPVAGSLLRCAVMFCTTSLCLLSLGGTIWYARVYDLQAQKWSAQMSWLAPARDVVTLREKTSPYITRPTVQGVFNRFYTGEFFSVTYALEHGGFASRLFNNGPVRPRRAIPIPAYDWPGFDDTNYVAQRCSALQQAYDAVLFWGQPDAEMTVQLDACFTPGPRWQDMAIWRRRDGS